MSNLQSIKTLLSYIHDELGYPVAYSHFSESVKPPYVVYLGAGQNRLEADDTYYWTRDSYSLEYYFEKKNAVKESSIEAAILANGWRYEKSDDSFIESEGLFVIYYTLN